MKDTDKIQENILNHLRFLFQRVVKKASNANVAAKRNEFNGADIVINENRLKNHFLLGMLLPVYEERELNTTVLDAKKEDYGRAIKNIEAIKKTKMDILNVDPDRASNISVPDDVSLSLRLLYCLISVAFGCELVWRA